MSAKAAAAAATIVDGLPAQGGGKKSKKLLIIILAVVLVLAAAGGGAAYFLLGGKKKHKGHGGEHVTATADEGGYADEGDEEDDGGHSGKPPVYESLEPFVVNLATEAADRYLQVGIDVKVSSPEIAEKIKQHLPEIRNEILLILSSKKVDELTTLEGKNRLRVEIRDAVNKPIGYYRRPPEGQEMRYRPRKGALDVLLTSFVIQ
ncbi:MAG: flagellar basal body-associated protein FliL [Betaproteobacteria bacterium]|nr:flagellar basal body-associated protein FliL [Betaproteobacteria bacterium]